MPRTAIAAAVACAALALPAAPAAADPLDDHRRAGGCSFHSVRQDAVTGTRYVGQLHAAVVTYAVAARHNPVTIADLRCDLRVNGGSRLVVPGTTAGPAGVVPVTPIEFEAGDDDLVDLCVLYRYADAHGNGGDVEQCTEACCGALTLIPEPVAEVLDDLFRYVVDPEVCAVLRTHAGGDGPLTVGSDGDVYLNGERWWDCPPYDS